MRYIAKENEKSKCRFSVLAAARKLTLLTACSCATLLMSLPVTSASAISWLGGTSTDWFDASNWQGGVVPSAPFDVEIVVGNPIGINGGTANTANIRIGHDFFAVGDGQLIIFNSGTLNSQVSYIDHKASPSKTNGVVLSSGGKWNNTQLIVGNMNDGLLQITNGSKVTSTITSGAGLSSTGIGEVEITGAGSTWDITSGNLILGDSGKGIMKLADGGNLDVNSASGTVYIAKNSGSFGGLAIGGYANAPAEAAGTVSASNIEFGDGTGNLLFNHTNNAYTFSQDISGNGSIYQLAGSTTYTGNAGAFTGNAYILGGLFNVNDVIGSGIGGNVIVANTGTIGGVGNVVSAEIQNGGTLAPGNSIGILNSAGIIFETGSIFQIEINDGGYLAGTNNDLLDTLSTTINGGVVNVISENGTDDGSTYTPGTYTIINSVNPISGTFDGISDNFAYLDFALDYSNPNSVLLHSSVATASFCLAGMTTNQCSTGDAAFSLGSGSLFNAVLGLSNIAAPEVLDQLSGEIHATGKTLLLQDRRYLREAAMVRLRNALKSETDGSSQNDEIRITDEISGWGQLSGASGDWAGNSNAASVNRQFGGIRAGVDARIWDGFYAGVLGAVENSKISIADRNSSGDIQSYSLGVYGAGKFDEINLAGGASHSWNEFNTTRVVSFNGFSDQVSAEYTAQTLELWFDASYALNVSDTQIEPFVNFAHVNLSTASISETGGAAALSGRESSQHATFATLGIRAERDLIVKNKTANVHGMIGWRQAFSDTPKSRLNFASGSNDFEVEGISIPSHSVMFDVGVDLQFTDTATLGLAYSGQYGPDLTDHSAKLTLGVDF